jgi:sulfotransferase
MVQKIFYNTSLPRAGSTLLQNILMQNPEFYSTPTSGLADLLMTARSVYSTGDAFRAQDPEEMKNGMKNFYKQGLYGFYNAITNRPYVFEKSRAWIGNYGFLEFFEEDIKMVCMVRDLRSIFSSMEKNFRKNQHKDPMIVNGVELKNMTTVARIDHFSTTPPVGPSIEWLFEAIHQGYDKKIHFIRFEDLTVNPEKEMKKLYNYLGFDYYPHHFTNMEQLTHENDVIHGIFGDHTIKPNIEPYKEDFIEVLSKEQSDRIRSHYDWFYKRFNYL